MKKAKTGPSSPALTLEWHWDGPDLMVGGDGHGGMVAAHVQGRRAYAWHGTETWERLYVHLAPAQRAVERWLARRL